MPRTLSDHLDELYGQNRRMDTTDVKLYTWQLFRGQAHLSSVSGFRQEVLLALHRFRSNFVIATSNRRTF